MPNSPNFWVLFERPGGDEHPSGDASYVGSILMFSELWVDCDQWNYVIDEN